MRSILAPRHQAKYDAFFADTAHALTQDNAMHRCLLICGFETSVIVTHQQGWRIVRRWAQRWCEIPDKAVFRGRGKPSTASRRFPAFDRDDDVNSGRGKFRRAKRRFAPSVFTAISEALF